jgi:NADP-dependent aldehyde dehydrogenase
VIRESTAEAIGAAVARARQAFPAMANLADKDRAEVLRNLAVALERHRDELVTVADRETSLGHGRLSSEIDRTAFQLRAFAEHIAGGAHRATVIDEAVDGPPPRGRPVLVRTRIPIGPVAVFAASNFPFAFSVLGGDTAAALAAGNPVIVKAHPGHPGLSRSVFTLASSVVRESELPDGVLALVEGGSPAVGQTLVLQPDLAAVAFTGSVRAGKVIAQAIHSRPRPIPFFGELGSVNPVVAFPQMLAANSEVLAEQLAGSILLGAGQFCTSPGILLLVEHPASRRFVEQLSTRLGAGRTHAMLSPAIRSNFETRTARAMDTPGVRTWTGGLSDGPDPLPTLLEIPVQTFLRDDELRDEIFGPCCVTLFAADTAEMQAVLRAIGGSLTVTIWAAAAETTVAQPLVDDAMSIAGRVLFGGVPTGVAVAAAQQHGGPWPSSTRPDTTSVGLSAIERFLRPVCLQNPPRDGRFRLPGFATAEHVPAISTEGPER